MSKNTDSVTKAHNEAFSCDHFQETNQNKYCVGYCNLKKELVATYCCEHRDQYPKYCPLDTVPILKSSKTILAFFPPKTLFNEKNAK